LKDPQAFDPHVAVQITPAPNGSFATWSLSDNIALTFKVLGSELLDPEMEIAIGAGITVRLKLLLCDGLLVAVAVMVMELLIGTTDGAV
jgi:hypothetical protein